PLYLFFFTAPAPSAIYTLSLHDALPISARDGDFAIGERVERIHQLFGAHAAGRFDFDLDVFGGEIVDAIYLDLAFARRVYDFTSDRKSTRLNSSHLGISYAVFCLKKKKK